MYQYDKKGTKSLYPCRRGPAHCLFTGKRDGDNDSWVAANVCDGLVCNNHLSFEHLVCWVKLRMAF